MIIIEVRKRKCGWPKEGGVYIKAGDERSPNGILVPFIEIDPPIPYQVPTHRGPKLVDAIKVLSRASISDWWIDQTQKTEDVKRGIKLELAIFGMTISKRSSFGSCEGIKDADLALQRLMQLVRLGKNNQTVIAAFDSLSRKDIHKHTKLLSDYETLYKSINHCVNGVADKNTLIDLQAAVWRIVYQLPPKQLKKYSRDLSLILAWLNLTSDAVELIKMGA